MHEASAISDASDGTTTGGLAALRWLPARHPTRHAHLGELAWSLHMVAALVAFLSLIAACLVFARLWVSVGRRGPAAYAAGTGICYLAAFVGFFSSSGAGVDRGRPRRRGGARLGMALHHRGMAAEPTPR
jgi:hypothetical protein